MLDHFGYYVPTIQWLQNYGLVKGISNLDLILGQMSVWHIFQAGFSGIADPFLRMNSVLLIIYALYSIEKKSWIQLCLIPFLLLFIQSPSPDLPVLVFSLIVLNEILNGNKNLAVLFGFSVWVFTIKPTMIWLPVLTFLYSVFILKASYRKLIFGIGIMVLFFVKNIWTFGYPVFPLAFADFGTAWKPDPEVLKLSSQYATQKTYDMQYSYRSIRQFSVTESISRWLFLKGIKSVIHILFVMTLILLIVYTAIRKKILITLICIAVIVKCILIILFSAQYRFFIDVFFVVFFILCRGYVSKKASVRICLLLSIGLLGCLTFPSALQSVVPSFRPGSFMGNFEKEQLYRPSVYHYNRFRSFKVGNLSFHVSEKYPFNFDTPLPAISESYIFEYARADVFPQLKDGKDIRKGFTHQKLTEEEQLQVKQVMHIIEKSYR
ncbi:LIC_10190 family membrane protein [Chryseobacterium sp. SORGH_AS_1175]|uniref:LIC_10190 family membrane protein n=1 Tax=Chryseobacterium sp. SORGH_AS_1175 TaxID=3041760 RepID=UPI0038D42336